MCAVVLFDLFNRIDLELILVSQLLFKFRQIFKDGNKQA